MSETVELDRESNPQAVRGYAYYDWAKSAFETSVTVAVLPVWFSYLFLKANGLTTNIGSIDFTGDAIWSFSVSGAALLVALLSPSFGVIADRRAIKMWWLRILTYVGAGGTVLLAIAPFLPVSTQWVWLMVMFVIANVGLNGASVFYNAILPHMGTDDEMDAISNKAFAYGYLGGGILLAVHLGMVMLLTGDWVVPMIMASSGIWWYGFALFTFKWVPEPPIENEMESLTIVESAKLAFSEIRKTLSEVSKFKTLFLYMLAYFFFIDGINTVTALGGIYGPVVLGITPAFLMVAILMVQIIAAPSALVFTRISEKVGTKQALTISLVGWIVLCFAALAFAPLELDKHDQHDIMYEWDAEEGTYKVTVSSAAPSIAQKIEFSDSEFNEQEWAKEWGEFLPIIKDKYVTEYELFDWQWKTIDDDGKATTTDYSKSVSASSESLIEGVLSSFSDTRFSVSVLDEDGVTHTSNVGIDHPTSLGDGALDFIPETARSYIWEPMGIAVGFQFIILGMAMGSVLGGSQGLARSMFGQMVPETRSAEFFGFFGFFGKVAALLGPLIYGIMTVMFDSRVGILSIAILILTGALLLRGVDVEQGRSDAQAEDARNRGLA
ncbi:MAG: MFS transporter [Candidatus Thalassarchaeaceae archaeon]|nr:MFS transporter [Candidatus Thalassarchaeaceae archaeon]